MISVYIYVTNNMPNDVNVLKFPYFISLKLHDTDTSGMLISIKHFMVNFGWITCPSESIYADRKLSRCEVRQHGPRYSN